MENIPNFRIIGNISEEKKKEQKKELMGELYENHLSHLPEDVKKEIEEREYKKTPTEEALIEFANNKSNELMIKSKIPPYDIPEQNFHIIPTELYRKICGDNSYSETKYPIQAIFLDAKRYTNNAYQFGATAFHEILHLKGHFSAEINETPDGKLARTPYREGVGVRARQKSASDTGYYEYFRGLHEAIVTSYERDYIEQLLELPELKKEKGSTDLEAIGKIKKEIVAKEGTKEDNIVWVGKNADEYIVLPYNYFTKVFDYVLEEICKKQNDEYSSLQSVRAEFLKSHFSGHLVTIGKMVEQTFGTGSFRLLGMMDDKKSAIQVLKSLHTCRLQKIKQKGDSKPRTN